MSVIQSWHSGIEVKGITVYVGFAIYDVKDFVATAGLSLQLWEELPMGS